MRILRVYHGGRDATHRERDRALLRAGVELTLVVPARWPGPNSVRAEPFPVVELPVRRPGDVNRHRFVDIHPLTRLVTDVDVVDLHEEPFSAVTHQVLKAVPPHLPVIGYTAQNIDKRWPPPFFRWERAAFDRLSGMYPCSDQAAAVLRRHGYRGPMETLPLGVDSTVFHPGPTRPSRNLVLGVIGRLVPEKGVLDAVDVLVRVRSRHANARLVVAGDGPEADPVRRRAAALGVQHALDLRPWAEAGELADLYRELDVLLVPSRSTRTWVEQFGRVVVEAQACGTAVVAYDSGALPEVVGAAGLLVAEGDAAAMADAVLTIAGDSDLAGRLRRRGIESVADWDAVAVRQVLLYERALEHREEPSEPLVAEPAEVPGGGRPFALPVLRKDTSLSRSLARSIDLIAKLRV